MPPQAKDGEVSRATSLSAEVFVIPLDNAEKSAEYLIYAPLRKAAFVANAALVNQLAALQAGAVDVAALDPRLLRFLRGLELLDAGPEPRPVTRFEGTPAPAAVTLFLTTDCNLRCVYCYASAGDTSSRSMTLDVANKGIDFVAENALRLGRAGFEVAYHGGGEPTVNWPVLTGSFAHARAKAAALGLTVAGYSATNGVLSDKKIKWIIENLDGCSMSFDGLPGVNDKLRVTGSGRGSSDKIMHTAARFDDAGFSYGLRLTVTEAHIRRLVESIEFIVTRFKPRRIQVEPAYRLGRWRGAPSAETEDFIAQYRRADAVAREHGHELYYSAARLGVLTNHFCGVTQDTFALSPDGNVSACYEVFGEDQPHADTFFYGQPTTTGYAFDQPVLDRLRAQSVEGRELCEGCFAKWSCAGDCYHKALHEPDDAELAGSERCHITRELTKDQILARIRAAGGLFWHKA